MEGRLEGNFFWFPFFRERIPSYTFPSYLDYLLQNSYIHYMRERERENFKISKAHSI